MILSDRDVRFMKPKEKIVKNTRRFAVILMSAFLAAALFINLTLSYLVVNKNRDNVFALGNVSLLLSEDNFPQDENDRILVPKGIIQKDPKLTNIGSTDEYVFLKVTVPLCNVRIVSEANNNIINAEKAYMEIFNFISNDTSANTVSISGFTYNNTGRFGYDSKWELIDSSEDTANYTHTYLFGYSSLLTADISNSTTKLFDKMQLRNILEGDLPSDVTQTVRIEAYGIQAEELLNNITVSNTENVTKSELTAIFDLYKNQEG